MAYVTFFDVLDLPFPWRQAAQEAPEELKFTPPPEKAGAVDGAAKGM
jgi:hypothetical protein